MKLQKLNSTNWHTDAAKLLKDNFGKIHSAFTDATKRAVWMGMFLNHIKAKGKADETIPHGEFGPWLEKNVPDLNRDTIATYMKLATGVCVEGKFQISDFPNFAQLGHLPPQIEKVVEGKTQSQLMFSFGGGGKAEKSATTPRAKLSPTQQHEELAKNIQADFAAYEAAGLRLLQMAKDTDFVLGGAVMERADEVARRFREKVKRLSLQKIQK